MNFNQLCSVNYGTHQKRFFLKHLLELRSLYLLLKVPKAQFTYLRALHKRYLYTLFLTLGLDPPKGGSIFLFSAKTSSATKKYDTFGPSVPGRGLSLVIAEYLFELLSIA